MTALASRLKGNQGVLLGFVLGALALLVVAPAMLSDFRLSLFGRFICYAIVAVGIGLAWGRGGMLILGQGVFFGLGGYVMAMHLKLADAGPSGVPDFMRLYGSGQLPIWWEPFRSPVLTLLGVVLIPSLVAFGLGAAIFRRRVRGAYFAILSQALAAAFAILLIGQVATIGGFNGLNGFRSFFGYNLFDPVNKRMLFYIAAVTLLVLLLIVWQLYRSRYGELLVAVRDQEERVRFLGYDPASIKLVAYVLAAAMAGIAGALFVPIVGIISPANVGVVASITFLIGVAIGGRATLFGPVLGALAVAGAQTTLSESFPSFWSYFQGALFVLVVAFLPGGLSSLGLLLRSQRVGVRTGHIEPPSPAQRVDVGRPPPPEPLSGVRSRSEAGR
ncbi:MAG TPA: urea ABC transporter permease subunit UrtC [Pseudonocardiaceae bacterium]|jgi:urea transport system permease protein|nr:urea ABC transporter permease subunit UrtC [Pseudonocardiaceae bacterium]